MKTTIKKENINKKKITRTEKHKKILSELKKGKSHIEYYGKTLAAKMRKINSDKHKGKKPHNKGRNNIEIYGEKRAKEIKEKIRKSKIGNKSKRKGISLESEYGVKKAKMIREKLRVSHLNYKIKDSTRKKLRECAIQHIEKCHGKASPFRGKDEECILSEIEEMFDTTLIRQFRVIGYFLDGYDDKHNIVYEIDEGRHFKTVERKEYTEKHLRRKNEIINFLKCKWVSISS